MSLSWTESGWRKALSFSPIHNEPSETFINLVATSGHASWNSIHLFSSKENPSFFVNNPSLQIIAAKMFHCRRRRRDRQS